MNEVLQNLYYLKALRTFHCYHRPKVGTRHARAMARLIWALVMVGTKYEQQGDNCSLHPVSPNVCHDTATKGKQSIR